MNKKHKFIDKRNAVKFNVVNRSQRDPLAADPDAPRGVLQTISEELGGNDNPSGLRKEEQIKFGIYFDDDYDYLQHLRDAGEDETQWEEVPDHRRKEESEEKQEEEEKPAKEKKVRPNDLGYFS